MTIIQKKCLICGKIIRGSGYEMYSLSENHLRQEHEEDWLELKNLTEKTQRIREKYGLFLNYA